MTSATVPSPLPAHAIHVASLAEVTRRGFVTVRAPSASIVVFASEGRVRAVDNRCPHMGFPLSRGSVRDGILTCHWHQARFDLASGCTFDLFADDVPTYDTWVQDEQVFVSPRPARVPDVAHHMQRLRSGVELDVPLVQAKSLLGLLDLDADLVDVVREVALYATRNLVQYSEGLVRLGCVANLAPQLRRETTYLALHYAVRQIARETASSVARRRREALDSDAHDTDQLRGWLRQWVRTRHRDAAERTLLTAARSGAAPDLADLIVGAASERLYANTGHVLDFCNKALELIELLGPESTEELVPLLVLPLTQTRGEEESTTWHHPVDIVEPMRELEQRLPELLARGEAARLDGARFDGGEALLEQLLGDDPLAILAALEAALAGGATAEELARRVAHAASLRLARFATSNEVTDWFGPQHSLNFANAVHQAVCRGVSPDKVRGVFQAAIAVWVDRYLNVPPARLPSRRGGLDDLPADEPGLRAHLLELLDQRAEIDQAARVVSRWLALGLDVSGLIDALTFAAVREDIDFHSLQVIEASARQSAAWGSGPELEHVWVGAVRNLAAHCPTRRAGQQTADIAARLHRGDRVFESEEPDA